MTAEVKTELTAKITLTLTESEALGLMKLCGYNDNDLIDHLAKFIHGYAKGSPERSGLISLLTTGKSLYAPLQQIEKIRKENQNIPVK